MHFRGIKTCMWALKGRAPALWPLPRACAAACIQRRLTAHAAQAAMTLPRLWRAVLPSIPLRSACGSAPQACASASGPLAAAGTSTLSGSDWK